MRTFVTPLLVRAIAPLGSNVDQTASVEIDERPTSFRGGAHERAQAIIDLCGWRQSDRRAHIKQLAERPQAHVEPAVTEQQVEDLLIELESLGQQRRPGIC